MATDSVCVSPQTWKFGAEASFVINQRRYAAGAHRGATRVAGVYMACSTLEYWSTNRTVKSSVLPTALEESA